MVPRLSNRAGPGSPAHGGKPGTCERQVADQVVARARTRRAESLNVTMRVIVFLAVQSSLDREGSSGAINPQVEVEVNIRHRRPAQPMPAALQSSLLPEAVTSGQ